jgi:hypothetical protein
MNIVRVNDEHKSVDELSPPPPTRALLGGSNTTGHAENAIAWPQRRERRGGESGSGRSLSGLS